MRRIDSPGLLGNPHRVAVLLVPEFPLMAFSGITEPLRAANRLAREPLYQWRCLSLEGAPVSCSSGISVGCDGGLGDGVWADTLLVCAGPPAHPRDCKPYHHGLRQHARHGCAVGGVSAGAMLLADAALLDGYRSTVHWEYIVTYCERYPQLDVVDQIYVIDRARLSCAGGTAAMDMMLAQIAHEHGQTLATEVASQFIHERTRSADELQRRAEESLNARQSVKMAQAIRLMREHLDEPLPTRELAAQVNLSLRQLERLFKRYKQQTPQGYYLALRLDQARRGVTQSGRSMYDIAVSVGFVSQSHFSKCYRERFGVAPLVDRNSPQRGPSH